MRVDRAGGGGVGADVQVGGQPQPEFAGVAGAVAGGTVGVD